MGHSRRTKSVSTSGEYRPDLSRDEAQAELAELVEKEGAASTVDTLIRYFLPLLPDGSAKLPLYEAARYGGKFLWDVEKHGLQKAVENLAISYVRGKVAHEAINGVVGQVSQSVVDSGANRALANFAEEALSETMSSIMVRGADAL